MKKCPSYLSCFFFTDVLALINLTDYYANDPFFTAREKTQLLKIVKAAKTKAGNVKNALSFLCVDLRLEEIWFE